VPYRRTVIVHAAAVADRYAQYPDSCARLSSPGSVRALLVRDAELSVSVGTSLCLAEKCGTRIEMVALQQGEGHSDRAPVIAKIPPESTKAIDEKAANRNVTPPVRSLTVTHPSSIAAIPSTAAKAVQPIYRPVHSSTYSVCNHTMPASRSAPPMKPLRPIIHCVSRNIFLTLPDCGSPRNRSGISKYRRTSHARRGGTELSAAGEPWVIGSCWYRFTSLSLPPSAGTQIRQIFPAYSQDLFAFSGHEGVIPCHEII